MIEEFLNYLKFELNRSDITVARYGDDLRTFKTFFKNLDTHLSWESIDSDIIRDWMESMMDKGNSASSINRRLSAVRSFYRFALSRKKVDSDPSHSVQGPKKSKPLPQFLKESEMIILVIMPISGRQLTTGKAKFTFLTWLQEMILFINNSNTSIFHCLSNTNRTIDIFYIIFYRIESTVNRILCGTIDIP